MAQVSAPHQRYGFARCCAAVNAALALAAVMLMALSFPGSAAAQGEIEVDLELVLAVDISLSMDGEEQRLQREGYVAAIVHDEVIAAIRDGLHGRIALTFVEWAGTASQFVVVPWTLIDGDDAARAFAANLASMPLRRAFRTSISGVLDFGYAQFEASGFRGLRRVIDVSGDGANNQGMLVAPARDRVVERGVVINGLPIMIEATSYNSFFDLANLHHYFEDCVIGGPGAFVIPITDREHFASAIRRKLILEIAGSEPRITPTAERAPVDCTIGEKQWQRWQQMREY